MAKKPAVATTRTVAAAPARAAKPRAPRVKSATHSKIAPAEPVAMIEEVEIAIPMNATDGVAKLAYGYWEARGYQGGNPLDDWVRAEREFNAGL